MAGILAVSIPVRLLVLSDVHYAAAGEQARRGHEALAIQNPLLRLAAHCYRKHIWLADPYSHNPLLDTILEAEPCPDLVVANGDFNLDTRFIGVSDEASMESARECLAKLRTAYGERLLLTIGDHELGKMSLFGGAGGLRLESWNRTVGELGIRPFWHHTAGAWNLVGITSTLVALPLFEPEILPAEKPAWEILRASHLQDIERCFDTIPLRNPILLCCHDPSALPFLQSLPSVRKRLPDLKATLLGHLHSPAVFDASRWLAGMPSIRFLGNTVRRLSTALQQARSWEKFRPVLCPSPSGIELTKDGGYLTTLLTADVASALRFQRHRLPR
ncbi:MAG: hypothetical protein EXS36_20230 [Pedosphaera sp.]|nr:hypothetical protein [Pedosphaera sp.]